MLRLIRGKPLHYLDILREIHEKDIATGSQVENARENVWRWKIEKGDGYWWEVSK